MGLKENIDAVKQEISTEEQFLESIIKSERFFKKYKKIIVSIVVVAIVSGLSYGVVDYINEQKLNSSNEAYKTLMSNPKDEKALKTLQENNQKLYDLFVFTQAVKNSDKDMLKTLSKVEDPIVSDLASYQLQGINGTTDENSKLLKGMSLLHVGYKLMLEGKVQEAKLKFAQIEASSPLKTWQII